MTDILDGFDERTDRMADEQAKRLRAARLSTGPLTPEQAARANALSDKQGRPFGVVAANLDAYEEDQRLADVSAVGQRSPQVGEFLSDPRRMALAGSEAEGLEKLAGALAPVELTWQDKLLADIAETGFGLWGHLSPAAPYRRDAANKLDAQAGTDVARSVPSGALLGIGGTFSGVGELYNLGERTVQRGLDAIGLDARIDREDIPVFLRPGDSFVGTGRAIKDAAEVVGAPQERQNTATGIASGVGQLVPMVAQGIYAPQTLLATAPALGADQMADAVREADAYGTWQGDVAIGTGAAVIGALERIGLEGIVNRLPPKIRDPFYRYLASAGLAGLTEGVTEGAQQVAQNAIIQQTVDGDQAIGEGVVDSAVQGGGAAAIFRALLGIPGAPRSESRRAAEAIGKVMRSASDTSRLKAATDTAGELGLGKSSPADLSAFVAQVAGEDAVVYLPAEAARTLFQSDELLNLVGNADELAEQMARGELSIPMAQWLAIVPQHANKDEIVRRARGDVDGMSAFDLDSVDMEGLAREFGATDEAAARAVPGEADSRQRIIDDVMGQLVGTQRFGLGEAETNAKAWGEWFGTIGRLTGQDPFTLYERYMGGIGSNRADGRPDPRASKPFTESAYTDALIESIRNPEGGPTAQQQFGPSLVDWLVGQGGLQDQGGELANMDAGLQRRGLVRPDGLLPDRARELLAEAGYLPEGTGIDALFNAISDEFSGSPTYSEQEGNAARQQFGAARQELLSAIEDNPTLRDMPREQFAALTNQQIVDMLSAPSEVANRPSSIVEVGRRENDDGSASVEYSFSNGDGFANVRINPDGTAYLTNIQLGDADSQSRGRGAGTAAYVEIGAALNAEGVTLVSTRWDDHLSAISPAALRVWEKLEEQGHARRTGSSVGKVVDRFTGQEEVREIPHYEFTPNNAASTSQVLNFDQPAFHGTGASVDRFSLQKIGTGTGDQNFGWGLYFASQKALADYYRKQAVGIARNIPATMGDKALQEAGGDRARAIATLTRKRDALPEAARGSAQAAIDWLRRGQDTGNLYQVEVPDSDVLLDWDKPLSAQPEAVRTALAGLEVRNRTGQNMLEHDPTGQEIYRALGEPETASDALFAAGIPGLQFADGEGKGTHNFVIWDEAAVSEPTKLNQDGVQEQAGFDESAFRPEVVTWAKERFGDVVAPNGNPAWQNFVAWFGDSKVVDEGGAPLVVYHGTGGNFDVFDNSKGPKKQDKNLRGVAWFSNAPEVASDFAGYQTGDTFMRGTRDEFTTGHSNVMPVFLAMRKPYIDESGAYAKSGGMTQEDVAELAEDGFDGVIWPNTHYDLPDTTDQGPVKGYRRNRFGEVFGNDVPYPNQYAVFRPEQIKSATGNTGNYSPESGSILNQAGAAEGIESNPNFRRWSNDAPLVRAGEAETHDFKSGQKVVVEGFHGTKRPDRIGTRFRKGRATSGPMAFFTSNPEIASNYAQGKQDTSIELDQFPFESWFKFKPKGSRSPVDIVRAWYFLDADQKAKIRELAPQVTLDDAGENIVVEAGNEAGPGNYDYELAASRTAYDRAGNPLKAMLEGWLNGGTLYGDEQRFMQVLELAGFPVDQVTFDSPYAEFPAVYPVYLEMQRPLVTSDVPQEVADALNSAAKRDRSRPKYERGADAWDKNTVTLREWVERFNEANNDMAWTSIPDKVTKLFTELGYDGIIDNGGKRGGERHKVYIPFDDTQVKSQFNRGTFDSSSNILNQSDQPFYSALLRTVEEGRGAPKRGDAAAWKGWLDGAQRRGDIRKAERDWLGLDAWLDGRASTTREELAEFVRANEVQVQEVTLGARTNVPLPPLPEGWFVEEVAGDRVPFTVYDADGDVMGEGMTERDAIIDSMDPDEVADAGESIGAPKFANYQLPGGENYRELLLTLPTKDGDDPLAGKSREELGRLYEAEIGYNPIEDDPSISTEQLREDVRSFGAAAAGAGTSVSADISGAIYQSSHFDQPNILAHVRYNERIDADGKRVLFIEEIQSDWHQAGRKRGYSTYRVAEEVHNGKTYYKVVNEAGETQAFAGGGVSLFSDEAAARHAMSGLDAVPNAPFKATDEWAMLAFKRMVRHAAENGFDRIAWTTGEQQAERYDLSKQIDELTAERNKDGSYRITFDYVGHGSQVRNVPATELDDHVGKELAQKIVERNDAFLAANTAYRDELRKPGESQLLEELRVAKDAASDALTISGDGLKVGGEGMKGFYDNILPKAVNKWAKKLGGKVGDAWVKTTDAAQADADLDLLLALDQEVPNATRGKDLGAKVHAMDLTDAMREAALSGQALFQREQGSKAPRGQIEIFPDRRMAISLFEGADRSTFMHESGHFFLEVFKDIAAQEDAPQQIKADMDGLVEWFSADPAKRREEGAKIARGAFRPVRSGSEWVVTSPLGHKRVFAKEAAAADYAAAERAKLVQAVEALTDTDIAALADQFRTGLEGDVGSVFNTVFHEQYARGWELYLAEGRAPSEALQSVFSKFKVWIQAVYKFLTRLDVQLTDEVRGIMDRMLASEEEIAAANARAAAAPLAADQAAASALGMDDAQFADYRALVDKAAEEAKAEVLAKLVQAQDRETKAWWKEERAKVKAEVEAEYEAMPVYRAVRVLSGAENLPDGTPIPDEMRVTLDRASLAEVYGDAYLRRLKGLYRKKGGVSQDDAAMVLGFASGDDLVKALANRGDMKARIEAETDARMRERHGDPYLDGQTPQLAMDAIHGRSRLELLDRELEVLARRAGQPAPLRRAITAVARELIARKTPRKIKPAEYLTAERKAAREAAAAAARGDYAAALAAKRQQAFNAAMYAEGRKAQDEFEVHARYLQRMSDKPAQARLGKAGQSYQDQVNQLLEQVEVRPVSGRQVERRARLAEWVAEQESAGNPVNIPQRLLDEAGLTNIRDMSLADLREVVSAIKQIAHLAKTKNRLILAGQERDAEEVDQEMSGSVLAAYETRPERTGDPTRGETIARKTKELDIQRVMPTNIARELDGYEEGGAVWRNVIQPVRDAMYGKVMPETKKMQHALADLLRQHYSPAELRRMDEPVWREAVGDTWSRGRILSLAMNWGSDGNREAILGQARSRLTPDQVGALLATLDARDYAFAQAVVDQINAYWPQIAETQRRRTGLVPEKVEPAPYTVVTADGETVEFKGGYYPLKYDAERSGYGATLQEMDDAYNNLRVGRTASAATKNGHTKERVGSGGKTVMLGLDIAGSHMRDVIRDLYLGDAVAYVHKVLHGNRFKDAVTATGKREYLKALDLWLKDVASGELGARSVLESVAAFIRQNLTAAVLTYKAGTALLQVTGLFQTGAVLGTRQTLKGAAKLLSKSWLGPNSIWNDIRAQSPFMAERFGQVPDAVLRVANARAGKLSAGWASMIRWGYVPMGRMQMIADAATWLAAKDKALRDNGGDEAAAIAFADDSVIRLQSPETFIEKAAVSRGTLNENVRQTELVKATTMLLTYMIAKGNVQREMFQRAGGNTGSFARNLRGIAVSPRSAMGFGIGMIQLFVLESMFMDALRNGLPEDDDDDGWVLDDWLAYLAEEIGLGTLSTIPAVSQLATAGRGYDAQGPLEKAWSGAVRSVTTLLANLDDEEELGREDMKAIINVAGISAGFPSSAANTAGDALWRVHDGEDVSPIEFIIRPERSRDE